MRIFRHTGGFWCSCGKQVRSREIRKGWRDLRWIWWLLSSAVIFGERHEIASPRENIFLWGGKCSNKAPTPFMIMLRSPQLRRQVTQSFVCWRCIAKSQPVGAFHSRSQKRSGFREAAQRHFSGGRAVSLSTSLFGPS